MSDGLRLGLTAHEHRMLARAMDESQKERTRDDDGRWSPWERSWFGAHNSHDGRALKSLARKGLIETKAGAESPVYRWRREP